MTVISTRLTVSPDGAISSMTQLPAGEHEANVTVTVTVTVPPQRCSVPSMPVHHAPWDDSTSLWREDLYDDDGRTQVVRRLLHLVGRLR